MIRERCPSLPLLALGLTRQRPDKAPVSVNTTGNGGFILFGDSFENSQSFRFLIQSDDFVHRGLPVGKRQLAGFPLNLFGIVEKVQSVGAIFADFSARIRSYSYKRLL